MKINRTTKLAFAGLMVIVLTAFGAVTSIAQPTALGQIGARALTTQEIKDHALPAATQTSGGLLTVGLGQPAYLEAQVRSTIAASNILGVTWELLSKPVFSVAVLEPSPLPANLPIYSPGDRGFYNLAGRQLLRPDLEGQYVVRATVATNGGTLVLTQAVTGGTYFGATVCGLCHDGGAAGPADKMTPWSQTHHATALARQIDDPAGHFNQNCIKCHSVGYDTFAAATNSGFDDIQAQTGWTFPASLTNGNYLAMPQALREKSNVQCENCHGPGSAHANVFGNTNVINWPRTSVSFSAGDCAQCHDAEPYHLIGGEWANSLHAVATRTPTGEGRTACVRCHSAMGFVDFADGVPENQRRTAYEAITCAACHDPHGDANNPHLLRKINAVALMDNQTVVTNGGFGQICMNCHISRRNAATYVETTPGSSQFGPHHGPQTDMLVGANAVTYGKEIASSAHASAVENTCVACHLQKVAANHPAAGNVGGHTFRPGWDGGTTDPADDVHLVGACVQCHGEIESFDFARQDYDEDGVIEGGQTEIKGLLERLGNLLPPAGPAVAITSAYTKPQLRAGFNYQFVLEDGSYGVHNMSYAVGLLKASIADLTDDADHDGISDKWEIAQFGNIHTYDGNSDPDGDGVKNALELSAGTNPSLVDSDNDGVNDLVELQAGSDPLNANDRPGFVVKIYNAAEIEFASQVGLKYQIQRVSDLTGSWLNVGSVTNGTGNNISTLLSTRTGGTQGYFRVLQVP